MNEFLKSASIESLPEIDVRMMNPLKLAYLGDAIYEAYIRVYIISTNVMTPHEMSKLAIKYVQASAQAEIVNTLRSYFTPDEWQLIKRGRNQKSGSSPKNASMSDYRYATGFETLMGYLYLTHQKERIYEIINQGINVINGAYVEENNVEGCLNED